MSRYPDVREGDLFHGDIEALAQRGLIGVPDGELYRPNDPITRGENAAYINRVLNYLGATVPQPEPEPEPQPEPEPVPEPEPEPEPEPVPPPEGSYIPVLQGPKLMHDGNPTVMSGYKVIDDGKHHVWDNVLLRGRVYVKNGSLDIRNSEIDGQDGPYCVLATGKVWIENSWLHNAEDGVKNNASGHMVTITDLSPNYRSAPHGDCIQLESTAPDSKWTFCYFDAKFKGGKLANAVVMQKCDFSTNQHIIVEDSYLNGGNYTVFNVAGPKGGPGTARYRRCVWGGEANYGKRADGSIYDFRRDSDPENMVESKSGTFLEWDVSRL